MKTNRRDFLKTSSAAAASAQVAFMALEQIIHGMLSPARAASSLPPKKYLMFYVYGGLPMWMYNLPLRPFSGQEVTTSGSIGSGPNAIQFSTIGNSNAFDTNGKPIYADLPVTANGQTIRMPIFWKGSIPTPSGSVAATELFKRMGTARGFLNSSDGHEQGTSALLRPNATGASILGAAAEASGTRTPIPAIAAARNGLTTYASSKVGLKLVDVLGQPLEELVGAFQASAAMNSLLSSRDLFSNAYQTVVAALQRRAVSQKPAAANLYNNVDGYERLARENFANLASDWSRSVSKYSDLIQRSKSISDILTSPISPSAVAGAGYGNSLIYPGAGAVTNADLRDVVQAAQNPRCAYLAESCAIAEFLLQNNLSSAMYFSPDYASNLNIATPAGLKLNTFNGSDMHSEGLAYTIPIAMFFYKAYSACFYELLNVMRDLNIAEHSVIHFASEMSRAPRADGTGSDHGWSGNTHSIFSDAIKTPFMIGNIRQNGGYGLTSHVHTRFQRYGGTWGAGAQVNHPIEGTEHLNFGHAASSICAAVGAQSPTSNFAPVFGMNSAGDIVPFLGPGETRDEIE